MTFQTRYTELYGVGLTLAQAIVKAGLTATRPEIERGCWTSVWVNAKLVRCYVKAPQ